MIDRSKVGPKKLMLLEAVDRANVLREKKGLKPLGVDHEDRDPDTVLYIADENENHPYLYEVDLCEVSYDDLGLDEEGFETTYVFKEVERGSGSYTGCDCETVEELIDELVAIKF